MYACHLKMVLIACSYSTKQDSGLILIFGVLLSFSLSLSSSLSSTGSSVGPVSRSSRSVGSFSGDMKVVMFLLSSSWVQKAMTDVRSSSADDGGSS